MKKKKMKIQLKFYKELDRYHESILTEDKRLKIANRKLKFNRNQGPIQIEASKYSNI